MIKVGSRIYTWGFKYLQNPIGNILINFLLHLIEKSMRNQLHQIHIDIPSVGQLELSYKKQKRERGIRQNVDRINITRHNTTHLAIYGIKIQIL